MAKDDMFIIMYKILKYMYECNKKGKRVLMEDLAPDCQLFSIPESYWTAVMEELIDNGLVKDVSLISIAGKGNGIKFGTNPHITKDGVIFLEENDRMKRAGAFLGTAFEKAVELLLAF